MYRHVLLALAALAVTATAARAAPIVISHSGRLLAESDQPVEENALGMKFKVFAARSPGDDSDQLIWESDSCPIRVSRGHYATTLGEECNSATSPLSTDHLPPGAKRYLEVSIGSTPLLPRMRFGVVPVAASAVTALEAQGLRLQTNAGAGKVLLSDANGVGAWGSVGSDSVTDGSLTNADLADTAAIATSKLSGPLTAVANGGLGALAAKSSIANAEVADDAAIATSKLSGPLSAVVNGGLGALAAKGAVTNAEVANDAAIAGTKVVPNFGAQTIQTTGRIGIGATTPGFPLHIVENGGGAGALVESTTTGKEARLVVRGPGAQDQIELNAWPGYAMIQTGKSTNQPLRIQSSNFVLNDQGAMGLAGEYTLVLNGDSTTGSTWNAVIEHDPGSFYLEIRAAFSHCGGGCHWAWRDWAAFYNSYNNDSVVKNDENNGGQAGAWTITRLNTHVESNGQPASRRFKIEKSANTTYNFGGPVNIRITANRPIKLISKTN